MHPVSVRQEIIDRVVKRRGHYHLFDRLDPARTALIVIDMQSTFCEPGAPAEVPGSRGIVEAINRLARGLRKAGGHVAWVNHSNSATPAGSDWNMLFDNFFARDLRARMVESLTPEKPGQQIWSEMDVENGDIRLHKNRYSALVPGSSGLERVLRSLGIDTLLITGTKTNVCCESTARDAMMMDFKVIMVSDGTAALSDEEHLATLENIIQQFGDVLTVDEILSLLTK